MMLVEITEPPRPRRSWTIDVDERYRHVMNAALGDAPAPSIVGCAEIGYRSLTEVDQWVEGEACYEVMWLLVGAEFAEQDEDTQRLMIVIAAEVLYGPDFDLEYLHEAVVWANDDEGL